MVIEWLALPSHSKNVLGLNPELSVWSLHVVPVSTLVPSRCSGFLSQFGDMQIILIGDSKLPIGVNVNECDYLSLHISPVINWRHVQSVPRPRQL